MTIWVMFFPTHKRETNSTEPLIQEVEFRAHDIAVVKTTEQSGNNLVVMEFALLIPASSNTSTRNVLPRDVLAALLNNLTQFYGQELGDFKVTFFLFVFN